LVVLGDQVLVSGIAIFPVRLSLIAVCV
jgi:hypothetical protein